MNHKKNYTTVADLLSDDGFLSWYFHDDIFLARQWDEWITSSPEKAMLAEQAIALLVVISNPDTQEINDRQTAASFERLMNKMIDEGKIAEDQIKTSNKLW